MKTEYPFKILIVEDQKVSRITLGRILEKRFKHIFLAEDGLEGLKLFLEEKPEMIITDIRMPKMDGLKMIKEIKKVQPDTKIIITTAHSDVDYLLESIHLKIDYFVSKPIISEDIISLIEKAFSALSQENTIKTQAQQLNHFKSSFQDKKKELKATESKLTETQFLLDSLFDNTKQGIALVSKCKKPNDQSFQIIRSNKAFDECFSLTSKKTNHKISDLFPDAHQQIAKEATQCLLSSTKSEISVSQLNSKAQTILLSPLNANQLYLFLNPLSPTTNIQQSYHPEIIKNRLTDLKNSFWNELTIELSKPLSSINSIVSLLKGSKLSRNQKQYIDELCLQVDYASQNLNSIVKSTVCNLVDNSNPISLIKIEDIIHNASSFFNNQPSNPKLQFKTYIQNDFPEAIYSNQSIINQIIEEFISNAVKHTPKGFIQLGFFCENIKDGEKKLRIELSDTGIGIIQYKLDKIFNVLYQSNNDLKKEIPQKGIGHCIYLAGSLDHKICAVSTPGEGSRFWIEIKSTAASYLHPLLTNNSADNSNKKNLLFITQSKVYPELFKTWGDSFNFVAQSISNFNELSSLKQSRFNYIYLDSSLPDWDARDYINEIKRSPFSSTPIIILSEVFDANEMNTYLSKGAWAYYSKPITKELILFHLKLPQDLIDKKTISHDIFDEIIGEFDALIIESKIQNLHKQYPSVDNHIIKGIFTAFIDDSKNLIISIEEQLMANNFNQANKQIKALISMQSSFGTISIRHNCEYFLNQTHPLSHEQLLHFTETLKKHYSFLYSYLNKHLFLQ